MEVFKVSHSKVKTWRRCRHAYHLKYVEKLRRKVKGRPLAFGSLVHESLELILAGKPAEALFKAYEKMVAAVFEEERVALGLDTVVPNARVMVEGYRTKYKKDGLKYEAVELEIEIPLFDDRDDIIFVGKVDAIVRDDMGLWVLERKTCKKIPEESVRLTDIQSVLYWWAIPRVRMKGRKVAFWPQPRGIIWDYVRSKPPSIPHILKSGELSKAACDTTKEIYLKTIEDNDLDPADYTEMLNKLEGADENFYRRIKLPFSRTMRDQVVEDFRSTAIEMKLLHGISRDRNLTRDCGWCEYQPLCQAKLRGLDTDLMIKKDYEVKTTNEKEDAKESRDSE